MSLTEVYVDGSLNTFQVLKLANLGYNYYMKLKDSNEAQFLATLHDRLRFQEIPIGLNTGTYCTFAEPIRKNSVVNGGRNMMYMDKNRL